MILSKTTANKIKKDMIQQLSMKNMTQSYYLDLVDQYVYYYNIMEDLKEDIKKNGVRVEVTSGNGFTTMKTNDSIDRAHKTTQIMLKILSDLDLKQPIVDDESDSDYL